MGTPIKWYSYATRDHHGVDNRIYPITAPPFTPYIPSRQRAEMPTEEDFEQWLSAGKFNRIQQLGANAWLYKNDEPTLDYYAVNFALLGEVYFVEVAGLDSLLEFVTKASGLFGIQLGEVVERDNPERVVSFRFKRK